MMIRVFLKTRGSLPGLHSVSPMGHRVSSFMFRSARFRLLSRVCGTSQPSWSPPLLRTGTKRKVRHTNRPCANHDRAQLPGSGAQLAKSTQSRHSWSGCIAKHCLCVVLGHPKHVPGIEAVVHGSGGETCSARRARASTLRAEAGTRWHIHCACSECACSWLDMHSLGYAARNSGVCS